MGAQNIRPLSIRIRAIKGKHTAANLVTNGRKGLQICFISSHPPNHARMSEYAKNLVGELANKSSIDRMNVLTDQITNSNGGLPENPKVR